MMNSFDSFINNIKEKINDLQVPEVYVVNDSLVYNLPYNSSTVSVAVANVNTLGELGRALAIATLIANHNVPPNKIKREVSSQIGAHSKRVDIVIELDEEFEGRNCIALLECKTTLKKPNDHQFASYVNRQLYNIAHSYANNHNEPYPLVLLLCTIAPLADDIDIDFTWFRYPDVVPCISSGLIPFDTIFMPTSAYASKKLPDFSQGMFFSSAVKPLTLEMLSEIKDAHALKVLLTEKLHQNLRKYGIVEDDAFFFIMNLLLTKIQDEINALGEPSYRMEFQVLPDDYVNKSQFFQRINNLYTDALVKLLHEDPKTATSKQILSHGNKEEILLDIVPQLQSVRIRSIRLVKEDVIGDVFLDFMHSIFRQSRGMFFTHPNIARFVCKALGLQHVGEKALNRQYDYILDPSCGSGTFLIEAMKLMFEKNSFNEISDLAIKTLFGIDNNPTAVTLCKVNMVAHGDGSANITVRDALSPISNLPFPNIDFNSVIELKDACTKAVVRNDKGFNYIITNPPFSLELKRTDNALKQFVMSNFIPYKGGVTTASECLFVERWFQLLSPGGKVGAVLPVSIFDGKEYFDARKLLLCYFRIYAIIGLPEHAFAPHAQQKTVLMFAEKRSLEEANKLFALLEKPIDEFVEPIKEERIIFFDAKNIGYVRKKSQKAILTQETQNNDLTDELAQCIYDYIRSNVVGTGIEPAVTFSVEELAENTQLNLSPTVILQLQEYSRATFVLEGKWEIVPVEPLPSELDEENILLCETGDITPYGYGILTPKPLLAETTSSNRERIMKKFNSGKFGKLKVGDIVIAPVRTYQKKIAVVTPHAESFLYSKDFIVLRKVGKPDIIESFKLFLKLIDETNIQLLSGFSSTGKGGYPKVKEKNKLLSTEFYDKQVSTDEAKQLFELYDAIYKQLVKKDANV